MVTIDVSYTGELHCKAVHGPSGKSFVTNAPVDNHGKGDSFSPTDLVATALGTCYLTVMAIYAEQHELDLKGMKAKIEKHMSSDKPRRISRLVAEINFPPGVPLNRRGSLEAVAINCPTAKSIHPDIEVDLKFNFPD